jgi:hypothetical protein
MNNQAQDNIRQLLYDQISNNDIVHMDILEYACAEDAVIDLIAETISNLSNDELSDAISRILADRQKQEVKEAKDACLQKAITSVQYDIFQTFIDDENNWHDEGPWLHDFLITASKLCTKYNDGGLAGIALIEWMIIQLQKEAEDYKRQVLDD